MAYQVREILSGRMLAEYHVEASTSFRAAEQATGRPLTLHRWGEYFLEVTDERSGRVSTYQYADLPY